MGIFAKISRKIASLGRNDGLSQNEDDLLDYAADLGCFSQQDDESHGVTFKPGSDTGGTDNPQKRRSKSRTKSKRTTSNGLTFSDHEVDVTSLAAGRMVINK